MSMSNTELTEVIRSTRPLVLGCIRRYLSSRFTDAIDDVAQEVYIRLARRFSIYRRMSASEQSNYLYTITKHECYRLNQRRWRQDKQESIAAREIEFELLREREDFGDPLVEALYQAVARLPEQTRPIFERLLAGMRPVEIARECGLAPGTVKSRIHRAQAQLRAELLAAGEEL